MLREDGIVVKVTYVLGDAFDSCSASKEAMITAASQCILQAKEMGGFSYTTPSTMSSPFLRSVHLI